MTSNPFKVIVIGGGPNGLTAAHSLHLAGIDFLVLERANVVAKDVGASLVLAPQNLRVMHQFSILDNLLRIGQELNSNKSFDVEGASWGTTHVFESLRVNHGSGPVAFHRAQLVQAIYDGLPAAAKDKVLLGKKLADIQSDEEGVTVTCEDSSVYRGSIVIGADGVHSRTRKLMRKLALTADDTQPWDEEDPFPATYRCLWCSFPRPTAAGKSYDTQHKDRSVMFISGRERGWIFLYEKMAEEKRGRSNYSDADIVAYADLFKDFPITETLKVRDVWDKRITVGMANLEEGLASHWNWGRIAIAGDAAHKFTPNAGRGFNSGIQDIVTLCNALHDMKERQGAAPQSATEESAAISKLFGHYEQERRAAIPNELSMSASITRLQAWANPLYTMASKYIMPLRLVQYLLTEFVMKKNLRKALILDYVAAEEPMKGAVPWDHSMPSPDGMEQAKHEASAF